MLSRRVRAYVSHRGDYLGTMQVGQMEVPERALAPMRVIEHLSAAHTYQRFLDGIEPTERIYHEGDPAAQLRAATRAATGAAAGERVLKREPKRADPAAG